jgi:WD domain, G-beta repeat
MPKRLACVTFSHDSAQVLAADRFGDVHAVPVPEALAAAGGTSLPPPCAIRTLPDDAPPLLGHFSTVTDIAATATLVATGDRENRVRVSHFPRAFDIQAFCMGHTSFVTRLAWTPGGLLVSGGGDGTARLWDPASGVQLGCVSFGASEAAADPAVVAALTVSKNRPDVAVAVVHGASHVYILTGLAERKLRIACSFLLSDGQGGAGALATGAVFDADGLLWVSARHSTTVAAYEVPAPSADGAVDEELVKCVKGLTVGGCAEGGAGPSDRTRPEVQTPGDWLASLRKNVYNPEWKGKKRRRGGDEGENEGDDE